MQLLSTILLIACAVLVANCGNPGKARVKNDSGNNAVVLFTAAGCAGVHQNCRAEWVYQVCKDKRLGPGEKATYKWPGGTSDRKVRVFPSPCDISTDGWYRGNAKCYSYTTEGKLVKKGKSYCQ